MFFSFIRTRKQVLYRRGSDIIHFSIPDALSLTWQIGEAQQSWIVALNILKGACRSFAYRCLEL